MLNKPRNLSLLASAPTILKHVLSLARVQSMNGMTQLALDGPVTLRREDLRPIQLADVKGVNGRSFLRRNLRPRDVQLQLAQGLRNRVEQTEPVFGLDFNDCPRFGSLVVKANMSRDAFAGVCLIERTGDLLFGDQRMKVHLLARQRLVEHRLEFVPLLAVRQAPRFGVGDV